MFSAGTNPIVGEMSLLSFCKNLSTPSTACAAVLHGKME
jgi:hypothetical protein